MNVDFVTAIKLYFANYINFNGRSTRAEYWWAMLFVFLLGVVGSFLGNWFNSIISLGLLLPNLAILTRRFHDGGHSGWWVVAQYVIVFAACGFAFSGIFSAALSGNPQAVAAAASGHAGKLAFGSIVALAVGIWAIVWCCQPSAPDNQYGRNPYGEE